jgi:hypothetical protein
MIDLPIPARGGEELAPVTFPRSFTKGIGGGLLWI